MKRHILRRRAESMRAELEKLKHNSGNLSAEDLVLMSHLGAELNLFVARLTKSIFVLL